jgi:hypothetical protein
MNFGNTNLFILVSDFFVIRRTALQHFKCLHQAGFKTSWLLYLLAESACSLPGMYFMHCWPHDQHQSYLITFNA